MAQGSGDIKLQSSCELVMGYAVQLYFDAELESKILDLRSALTLTGVTPTLERLGDRPHVSLAVLNEVVVEACVREVQRLAQDEARLPVSLAAFGAFPTTPGVVYLSPTPSEHLLGVHRIVHRRLASIGAHVHEHYVPDAWVPHSTIGFELPPAEVVLALSWLHSNFRPLAGSYTSVGLIEVPPVKQLARFPFCGSERVR